MLLFIIILLLIYLYSLSNINYTYQINENYYDIQKVVNDSFFPPIKYKIRIGIYCYCLKNGGRARITSILINYFYKIKIFNIYLFTKIYKEKNEYFIPEDIKRIIIINNITKVIRKYKINILIYQLSNENEIILLNKMKNVKVIYFLHSSAFYWIYFNYTAFKLIYKAYTNSNYVLSIIPFENNFIFKYWGIKSLLLTNFITYDYNRVIPSDMSSKNILMIGRGNNKMKRFEIGINAMEYVFQEIPESRLIIISDNKGIENLRYISNILNIEKKIEFVGYTSTPEIYFKTTILHLFPSLTEAFPLVLCETKIYGIPNVIIGLDYVSIAQNGTIIIYNDEPEIFGKEIIKIVNNNLFIKKLGVEARKSIKIYNNNLLLRKWIKLILSIYNGYYLKIYKKEESKKFLNKEKTILKNQVKFLKLRLNIFKNINLTDYLNFSFIEKIK